MDAATIVQIIGNLGFPMFVAIYLLVKLEPTIKRNTMVQYAILEHLRKYGDFDSISELMDKKGGN